MSLETLLAKLKAAVTDVTPVQANEFKGLACNVTVTADASDVTKPGGAAVGETSVTSRQNQTLQPKPSIGAGCTPVTSVTSRIDNGATIAANPATWRVLHAAYLRHHWNCETCKAAGQGRGLRCGAGSALWREYTG